MLESISLLPHHFENLAIIHCLSVSNGSQPDFRVGLKRYNTMLAEDNKHNPEYLTELFGQDLDPTQFNESLVQFCLSFFQQLDAGTKVELDPSLLQDTICGFAACPRHCSTYSWARLELENRHTARLRYVLQQGKVPFETLEKDTGIGTAYVVIANLGIMRKLAQTAKFDLASLR